MGFFSRLFGRRKPLPDLRVPNGWRVGDLAVSLIDWNELYADKLSVKGPRKGEVCRVTGVGEGEVSVGANVGSPCFYLTLAGHSDGYTVQGFRKAVEDSEAAEAEFTALIKRPVRKPSSQPVNQLPRQLADTDGNEAAGGNFNQGEI